MWRDPLDELIEDLDCAVPPAPVQPTIMGFKTIEAWQAATDEILYGDGGITPEELAAVDATWREAEAARPPDPPAPWLAPVRPPERR